MAIPPLMISAVRSPSRSPSKGSSCFWGWCSGTPLRAAPQRGTTVGGGSMEQAPNDLADPAVPTSTTMVVDQPPSAARTSTTTMAMNSLILLMGLATLSSPYAIAQGGWSGLACCTLVVGLYAYSTALMFRIMNVTRVQSYMDMAKSAFPKGHQVVSWLFYLETAGTLIGFFISVGDMATSIFPNFHIGLVHSQTSAMLLSCGFLLPMVWTRDLVKISKFSSICNLALVTIIGCVLYAGAAQVGFRHPPPLFRWGGLPDAFGIFAFAFGATPVFPTLYAASGKSPEFKRVVFCSFCAAVIIYAGLGLAGAFMFGSSTHSLITTNLPTTIGKTANIIGLLIPIMKFPILIAPVFQELDQYVTGRLINIICRSFITVTLLVIAVFFPHFTRVIELVGFSMTILLCSIIPNVCYLYVCGDRTNKVEKVIICLSTTVGIVIGVAGTIINIIRAV